MPKSKAPPSMKPNYAKMPPKPKIWEVMLELENLKFRAENMILKSCRLLINKKYRKSLCRKGIKVELSASDIGFSTRCFLLSFEKINKDTTI